MIYGNHFFIIGNRDETRLVFLNINFDLTHSRNRLACYIPLQSIPIRTFYTFNRKPHDEKILLLEFLKKELGLQENS